MNKIYSFFLFLACIFLLVACKTSSTESSSSGQQVSVPQKPSQTDLDSILAEAVFNNDDLDENTKKFVAELMKAAIASPETFTADLQKANANMLYVYPNPTSGSITVEFARDFPFKNIDMSVKNGISLDLYYMGTKIHTLEFPSVKDNKVTISSDYLQKEGTYSVSITGFGASAVPFMVVK